MRGPLSSACPLSRYCHHTNRVCLWLLETPAEFQVVAPNNSIVNIDPANGKLPQPFGDRASSGSECRIVELQRGRDCSVTFTFVSANSDAGNIAALRSQWLSEATSPEMGSQNELPIPQGWLPFTRCAIESGSWPPCRDARDCLSSTPVVSLHSTTGYKILSLPEWKNAALHRQCMIAATPNFPAVVIRETRLRTHLSLISRLPSTSYPNQRDLRL